MPRFSQVNENARANARNNNTPRQKVIGGQVYFWSGRRWIPASAYMNTDYTEQDEGDSMYYVTRVEIIDGMRRSVAYPIIASDAEASEPEDDFQWP